MPIHTVAEVLVMIYQLTDGIFIIFDSQRTIQNVHLTPSTSIILGKPSNDNSSMVLVFSNHTKSISFLPHLRWSKTHWLVTQRYKKSEDDMLLNQWNSPVLSRIPSECPRHVRTLQSNMSNWHPEIYRWYIEAKFLWSRSEKLDKRGSIISEGRHQETLIGNIIWCFRYEILSTDHSNLIRF